MSARAELRFEERLLRALLLLLRLELPLAEGLERAAAGFGRQRGRVERIAAALRQGCTLSGALAAFDPALVAALQVGERAGRLEQAIAALLRHRSQELEAVRLVWAAARYPVWVLGALAVSGLIAIAMVLPALDELVSAGTSGAPAWPGAFRLGLGLLVAAVLGTLFSLGRGSSRARWLSGLARLPPLATFRLRVERGAAFRLLEMALDCGVPLDRALELSARMSRGAAARELRARAAEVASGGRLVERGRRGSLFDPFAVALLEPAWGGPELPRLLGRIAAHDEDAARDALRRLLPLLEALFLIAAGAVTAAFLIGEFTVYWRSLSQMPF